MRASICGSCVDREERGYAARVNISRLVPVALSLLLSASICPAFAADGPTPYPDPKVESAWPGKGPIRQFGWMVDNRKYFWTQREKDQGAVVFVGDSLTANWKSLAKSFPALKVANRGIGGDTSRGVLFRFAEDVLDLKPRAIVLCAGTNDLSAHGDPANAESNLATMIESARKQDPKVPIVLCTLPPRDNPKAPMKPGAFEDLNARIAKLAASRESIVLVDLAKLLAGPDGKFAAENFTEDRLHIAEAGYQKWTAAVQKAFDQLAIK